jgi:very-short-patch-repair endonuclease
MAIPCTWVSITAWNVPRSNGKYQEEDERREKALSALGLRIVRFRNDEVVEKLPFVVEEIKVIIV